MQTSCSFNHFGAGTLKFTYVSTSWLDWMLPTICNKLVRMNKYYQKICAQAFESIEQE
jgi:hypothetical protein